MRSSDDEEKAPERVSSQAAGLSSQRASGWGRDSTPAFFGFALRVRPFSFSASGLVEDLVMVLPACLPACTCLPCSLQFVGLL